MPARHHHPVRRAAPQPESRRPAVDTFDDPANYVNLSGVRSTGLTASASLGKYVVRSLLLLGLPAKPNPCFNPVRKGIPRRRDMSREEQDACIRENPLFGRVICRCETITEGEIVEAIHRPIPARSMDAVKRRLRAGMGRCQGGFLRPEGAGDPVQGACVPVEEINKNEKAPIWSREK
jgi:glycerol-3-phosphate dehydrogenase